MRITNKVYVAFAGLLVAVGAIVALNVTGTDAQALSVPSSRRDCTAEDIIYCGALSQAELLADYDKNDGDVQAIYSHFGIKRTDLASSDVKLGKLKLDGTIVVDGKVVATNAQSTYRIRTKPEATTFVVNGKTYYMLPVKGVYYKEADVFVMFKNGQFFQAVQSSCGNIITATPVKPPVQPVYTCDSLKADKIDRTKFKFTAAATAKDGAQIVSYTFDFGDGKKHTDTGISAVHTYAKPGNYTVTVTVNVKVNGVTKSITSEKCKVTIKVEAVPVTPLYSCDSLKAVRIDRTNFKFSATATAKDGAQIVSYTFDFGDGQKQTVNSASVNHTYAKPGNYSATVTVNVKVDGVTKPVTSEKCKVTLKVEAEPVTPVYACTSLTAQIVKAETRTYAYTLTYTAEGGATLKKVTYNFGDNTSSTYEASKASKVEHSYAKEGSYRTVATLYFNVNNGTSVVEKTLTCEVAINISPEMCEMPGKGHLPKNSPECSVCEMPGKQHLPKNSPECAEVPTELPQTGMGGMLTGGMGLGSVIAAGYYWVNSRRSVTSALYKR